VDWNLQICDWRVDWRGFEINIRTLPENFWDIKQNFLFGGIWHEKGEYGTPFRFLPKRPLSHGGKFFCVPYSPFLCHIPPSVFISLFLCFLCDFPSLSLYYISLSLSLSLKRIGNVSYI
jgi:hypothetical protein